MVSSAIDLELDDLLKALERIRTRYRGRGDREYDELRADLPKSWPV